MVKRALFLLLVIWGIGFFNCTQAVDLFSQNGKEIRVAISSNDFKTNQYKEVTLSATAPWQVYDEYDKRLIAKFQPNQEIRFDLKAGMYDIYVDDNNIADMVSGPLVISTTPQGLLKVKDLQRRGKEALYRGVFTLDKVKNRLDTFLYQADKNHNEMTSGQSTKTGISPD